MKSKSRLLDGALVLLCAALTALAVKGHWSPLPWPVIVGAGIAGSAAQWWRRRFPQVATTAGAAAYVLSGNPGPLILGLYSGGAYAPVNQIWPLTLAGGAGFAGWFWIDEGHPDGQDLLSSAIGAALIAGAGLYSAIRRQRQDILRERAERAEADRAIHAEQARSAERIRIAREMHDILAHKIALIAVHAGAVELGTPDVRAEGALIRVTAREALTELRTVLDALREEPVLWANRADLIASATQAGQRIELRDRTGALPSGTSRIAYRVIQEGLTNAAKHAPGAPITVSLEETDDHSVTVIVHNGAATGEALDLPGAGAGLIGLAERVRLAGGSLASGPEGAGWQIRAVIPTTGGDRP